MPQTQDPTTTTHHDPVGPLLPMGAAISVVIVAVAVMAEGNDDIAAPGSSTATTPVDATAPDSGPPTTPRPRPATPHPA